LLEEANATPQCCHQLSRGSGHKTVDTEQTTRKEEIGVGTEIEWQALGQIQPISTLSLTSRDI
jgi:hypothetical protein